MITFMGGTRLPLGCHPVELWHPASGVPEVLGRFASPGWRFAYPALLWVTPSGLDCEDG